MVPLKIKGNMSQHPVPSAPISDDDYIDPDAILKVKTSFSPPPRYNAVIQISVEEEEERFVPDDVMKARAAAVKRGYNRSKTMMMLKVILILMLVSAFFLAAIATHGMISIKSQLYPMQEAIESDIWEIKNDQHERMSDISKIEDEVAKISETVYSHHTTTSTTTTTSRPYPYILSYNNYDYDYGFRSYFRAMD